MSHNDFNVRKLKAYKMLHLFTQMICLTKMNYLMMMPQASLFLTLTPNLKQKMHL